MSRSNYDVAIVGCGPVGATLANFLRMFGHTVAIFERYEEVFFCPRAGGADDETMRLLDTIGIYDRLKENGDFYEGDIYFCDSNERIIGAFTRHRIGDELMFNHANHYKNNMFYQPNLERALRDAYADSPLVDAYMGYTVLGINEQKSGVGIQVQRYDRKKRKASEDSDPIEINAKYIVGCDGANSLVLEHMNVGITDLNYSESYLILDCIVEDEDYLKARIPDGAKFILDPVYAGIVGKSLHGRMRFDFRRHRDSEIGAVATTPEEDEKLGNAVIQARGFDLDKFEIIRRANYDFKAKTPNNWRQGSLMVAGDAAHLTPPWSGQGLNMGMRDASNLSFKLNLVLKGHAGPEVLDTYTQERRPPSLKTIKSAVMTGKLMEATNPILVFLRNFALRLNGMFTPVAKAQFKLWQNKPPYKQGLIGRNHPKAGTWMIQPKLLTRLGKEQLMDKFIGLNFALISISEANGENVYRFMRELGGKVLKIGVDFQDHEGRFMKWCKENKVETVLLRPDRYIFDAGNDADALCADLFEQLRQYD